MHAIRAALLLALVWPAVAAASPFGEPEPLALGPAIRATVALAAVAEADGAQTVVFTSGSGVYALRRGDNAGRQFLGWGNREERHSFPRTHPALAAGADGTRVVAWGVTNGEPITRMLLAAPGRRFGHYRAYRVSGSGILDAAAAGDGTVVVAWDSESGIRVLLARGGAWLGGPATIPGSVGAGALTLAAGGDGRVGLLWVDGDPPVQARLALLGPGASSFAASEAVPAKPGNSDDSPALFTLAYGGYLVSPTLRTAVRRAPDGTWGKPRRVADDAALAALAARSGAPSPVTVRHLSFGIVAANRTAFGWAGGRITVLQEWGYFDNENPFLALGRGRPRVKGNRVDPAGTVVLAGGEHGVPVAGRQPGSITIYAVHGDGLYALARPHGEDRRAPRITLRGPSTFFRSSPDRTVWLFGSVDEGATVHVKAYVREAGRWRRVAVRSPGRHRGFPTSVPFARFNLEISLPVARGGCAATPRFRMRVVATAVDTAGRHGRLVVRRTVACHEELA